MRALLIAGLLVSYPAHAMASVLPTLLVAAKQKAKKAKKAKKTKGKKAPPLEAIPIAPIAPTTIAPTTIAPQAIAPASEPASQPTSMPVAAPASSDEVGEESGEEDEEDTEEIGKHVIEPKDELSAAPKLHPFLFGVRLLGGPAFGSELHMALSLGVAIGVRLPFLGQAFSIALMPSFLFGYAFRLGALPDGMTLGLLAAIEVAGRIPLGPGHLRISAAPTFFVGRTVGRRLEENVIAFGAEGSVGFLFGGGKTVRAGPLVGYRLQPYNFDDVRRYAHVVEVGLAIEIDRVVQ